MFVGSAVGVAIDVNGGVSPAAVVERSLQFCVVVGRLSFVLFSFFHISTARICMIWHAEANTSSYLYVCWCGDY